MNFVQRYRSYIAAIIFAAIVVIPIHYFFIQPFVVPDSSMTPNFRKGDVVLINRIPYFTQRFIRGDLIVFRSQEREKMRHLRRIIGLPGERIRLNDGILSINAKAESLAFLPTSIKDIGNLDAHEYFVISDGDFKEPIGLIDQRFIIGKPLIRIYPLNSIKVY